MSEKYETPVCYLPAEKGFFVIGKYGDDKTKYWRMPIVSWAIYFFEGASWASPVCLESLVSRTVYIQDHTGQITDPENRTFESIGEWLRETQ